MLNFYLFWSFSYLISLWFLGRTWKLTSRITSNTKKNFRVSLVIAIRDELENLPSLVSEIQKLQKSVYEVILIDDHSEDGSLEYLIDRFQGVERVRILRNQGAGKKEAISTAVSAASGDIICCSDADCQFSSHWIEVICEPFNSDAVQLVAGPVMSVGSPSYFSKFQQLEWSSILMVTNYFFSVSKPLMCSAANMAYRKSAFVEVGGYVGNLDQLSGDDEFLLKKISNRYPKGSGVYINQLEALVFTKSQKDWASLIQQRIRWAAKWKAHRSILHAFSAMLSFFIQLVWLGSVMLLFQGIYGFFVFFIVWGVKIMIEKLMLSKPLNTYFIFQKTIDFVLTSVIHPIFVLVVGMKALRGKFTWKGRS